jgi:malate dehydrogenase
MSLPQVCVVGAGNVGATAAHLLALKGAADVTLIDVVEGLAEGKALDVAQSAPIEAFSGSVQGTTDYEALRGSRLVVITAGLARKPGMSREELLAANAQIVGPIAQRIAATAPDAIIIVVTNPLDVMVALALRRSRFPRQRVMGMAGVLDSARLRTCVARRLKVAPAEVEAMVLGSHGELMVPLKGSLTVRGRPLNNELSAQEIDQLCQRTKDGGAEIVKLLKQGSAFYAPASGIVEMAEAILRDRHKTLPVCAWLDGEYGLREVAIGVPAQLGATGIERIVELDLSPEERQALAASAEAVRQMIRQLSVIEAGA